MGDPTRRLLGCRKQTRLGHTDPFGTITAPLVFGFGWAKPVPTNPRNYTSRWADLFVSSAGPGMNLLVAFLAINLYSLGLGMGLESFYTQGARLFFVYMININLVLMLFNLIPLGPLDGHYILPYFLSRRAGAAFLDFNAQYGHFALLGLLLLSFAGIPIFSTIFHIGSFLAPYLRVV